ncbi:MAG TPA: ABC transporter permease [Gemmatimonadaceae bacterium]|jgi:predicted permease
MRVSVLSPRVAARSLLRTPGFTVAAVLLLALGIGMATAMFTVYRSVIVQQLPVASQDRLVIMHPLDRSGTHLDVYPAYLDGVRRQSTTIASIAGSYHLGAIPSPLRSEGKALDLTTGYVTANLFDVLGVRPLLGRMLRPEDGEHDQPQVVVLSYQAWRRRFGADSNVIGRRLVAAYDGSTHTVVGVAPPGFEYPAGAELWQPFTRKLTAQIDIVARLKSGASPATARMELLTLLHATNPFVDSTNKFAPTIAGVDVHPFTDELFGAVRPALIVLASAVGLLLLIACVNVGSLLLVRGAGREREFAVRRAIGASAFDLTAQLVLENAFLGIAGGILGLGVAQLSIRVLLYLAPSQLPRTDIIGLGGAPLGIAITTTFIALLVFGLLPALNASRIGPNAALRYDSRAGAGAGVRQRRVRQSLVSSQIAFAVIMVAGALLLGRSLARLQSLDLGYVPERLTLLRLDGPLSPFDTPEHTTQSVNDIVARTEALPGVVAASMIQSPPFKGESGYITKFSRAEQSNREWEASPFRPFEIAGPDYFRTMGIPIVRGRAFLPSDTKTKAQVVIVSEELARRLWPGEDAVGRRIRYAYDSSQSLFTVVGVARDTHFRNLRTPAPVLYQTQVQSFSAWFGYLAVRTTGDITPLLGAIERSINEAYPGFAISRVQTMEQLLDGPLAQPRMSALLLSAFGLAALGLAAIGLFGVMSSAVRQRTREIGIRMALGATEARVRKSVLGEAMVIIGSGTIVGLIGALIATQLLRSQLFEVGAADPLSFGAACVALAVVGLAAAYLPARHATKIDPARALRSD